jgi:hypothetical protein
MNDNVKVLTAIQIRHAIDNIGKFFLFFHLQSNSRLARIVVYILNHRYLQLLQFVF